MTFYTKNKLAKKNDDDIVGTPSRYLHGKRTMGDRCTLNSVFFASVLPVLSAGQRKKTRGALLGHVDVSRDECFAHWCSRPKKEKEAPPRFIVLEPKKFETITNCQKVGYFLQVKIRFLNLKSIIRQNIF